MQKTRGTRTSKPNGGSS